MDYSVIRWRGVACYLFWVCLNQSISTDGQTHFPNSNPHRARTRSDNHPNVQVERVVSRQPKIQKAHRNLARLHDFLLPCMTTAVNIIHIIIKKDWRLIIHYVNYSTMMSSQVEQPTNSLVTALLTDLYQVNTNPSRLLFLRLEQRRFNSPYYAAPRSRWRTLTGR